MVGVEIGVLVVAGHGVFKNGDVLFLGEEEAVIKGLITARLGWHQFQTDGV